MAVTLTSASPGWRTGALPSIRLSFGIVRAVFIAICVPPLLSGPLTRAGHRTELARLGAV